MERMDRARLLGGRLWLTIGVILVIAHLASGHRLGLVTWLLVGVCVAGGAMSYGDLRLRWVAGRAIAVLLGLDFLGAVADRFGAFGPPGADGVSWGNWSAFVAETHTLAPWGPTELLAVTATVTEVGLGVLLISGVEHRWAGKFAAGLLFAYLVSMVAFEGYADMMRYAMPVLIGGALVASARGDRPASWACWGVRGRAGAQAGARAGAAQAE